MVAEGQAWFLRRYDRHRALRFMAMIEDMTPLRALSVGGPELSGAIEILRRYSDQDLTLTDAVGLHLLSELGLRHCWSTDFHLGLSGVTLVVHEH